MIIIGAKGHTKELLEIFSNSDEAGKILLFDDIAVSVDLLYDRFSILHTEKAVRDAFMTDKRFVLGIGGPTIRRRLARKFIDWGGELTAAISSEARIGQFEVKLGAGVNIMPGVIIYNSTSIGEGSLINTNAVIHHDAVVGAYTEISPAVHVLGGAVIGNDCMIGAGAMVLPRISIGNGAVIGAGAVVNKNIPAGETWAGVPAKRIQ